MDKSDTPKHRQESRPAPEFDRFELNKSFDLYGSRDFDPRVGQDWSKPWLSPKDK
jgi:hypothetical protein